MAIPVHGGPGGDGVFIVITAPWSPPKGYPNIVHGSSFVQMVHFPKKGCAEHRTILTYSQSTDPTSPFSADQTRLFSQERWVDFAFTPEQVRRSLLRRYTVSARVR